MWLPLLVILGMIFLYRWYRQSQILENLTDKYVFITGCDSGFGNLLAKQLDRRGVKVLAACLTETGAKNLKKETSSRLQTVILDISDSQSVSSAAKWVAGIVEQKGLWGLVNNAGIAFVFAPNLWQTKKDFAKVLGVNLLGMVDVTLNLAPYIMKARGRIVNVASVCGRLANVGGGYCPSKFGVEAFTDNLRRELLDFGVKVSMIEPGAFGTAILNKDPHLENAKHLWGNLSSEIKDLYGEQYYQQYCTDLANLVTKNNPNLHLVTDCMEHALTAVHPWTRYSAGWDAKLFYLPVSYLPTFMSDYLLCRSAPKPAHKVM